ncbi:helicase-like transcription factor CHR28 [Macadamia integrifolia]|uniref:helicase-like transcription factor CHR28 n=1 Tax=Macadamia integrifolia TaxID=60698 RepID=UPI001C52B3E6|nr:helicase-like transcription factor CHR28 [Macadamia integrifolia]
MQGQGYGHGSKYSDEEDYFSTSDSDLSVSDEGESHPHEPPTAEEEREFHKGKSVVDIRDDSDVSVPRKIHRVDLDLVEKKSKRSSEEEPAPHVEEDGGCRLDAAEKKEGTKRERPMLMWKILEEENERWIDANETKDTELDNVGGEMDEYAGDPPYLLIPLLKFQKEWLAWALKQEESEMRGGILADETGMGKTIQAIALVLTKQAMTLTLASRPFLLLSYSVMPETECTLVICPEVALMQWKNDMEKIAKKGIIRVLVYHGPKRKKKLYQFFENDFVLTTYSILSAEYRKVMPTKKKMKSSGLEADTSQYKKQDEQEAEPKENPAGSHHGAASRNSVLHSVKWTRIILDEVSSHNPILQYCYSLSL